MHNDVTSSRNRMSSLRSKFPVIRDVDYYNCFKKTTTQIRNVISSSQKYGAILTLDLHYADNVWDTQTYNIALRQYTNFIEFAELALEFRTTTDGVQKQELLLTLRDRVKKIDSDHYDVFGEEDFLEYMGNYLVL